MKYVFFIVNVATTAVEPPLTVYTYDETFASQEACEAFLMKEHLVDGFRAVRIGGTSGPLYIYSTGITKMTMTCQGILFE